MAEGEVGFSCNDPFPLSHVWLQTWKWENQAAGTILVGRALLLFSFPDFPGGLPIPGWLGGPIPVKLGKVVPASFPLSTYLHPQCLLFLLLSRPPLNTEQSHCLLMSLLLSRGAELANSVTLRFVSAKGIAILKSNFKTLETKESLSMVDF